MTNPQRSMLLHIASKLPVGTGARRNLLKVLATEGYLEQFLKEHGKDTRINPDTGNRVSMWTLSGKPKGSRGRNIFEKEFNAWREKKEQSRKEEAAKSPEQKAHDKLKTKLKKQLGDSYFTTADIEDLQFTMLSTESANRPKVPGVRYRGKTYYADQLDPKDIKELRDLADKLPKKPKK